MGVRVPSATLSPAVATTRRRFSFLDSVTTCGLPGMSIPAVSVSPQFASFRRGVPPNCLRICPQESQSPPGNSALPSVVPVARQEEVALTSPGVFLGVVFRSPQPFLPCRRQVRPEHPRRVLPIGHGEHGSPGGLRRHVFAQFRRQVRLQGGQEPSVKVRRDIVPRRGGFAPTELIWALLPVFHVANGGPIAYKWKKGAEESQSVCTRGRGPR